MTYTKTAVLMEPRVRQSRGIDESGVGNAL